MPWWPSNKCLLKELGEAGKSAPSLPPRKILSVGRSHSCKGKQRQESWVVTSWAKGQQAGTKEVLSTKAQESMHTGVEATSATSMKQEEKKRPATASLPTGFSGLVSLLDQSISTHCSPASLMGLALPTLPSLFPVWQTYCPSGILVTRRVSLMLQG